MIEQGVFSTGGDAELSSRALAVAKTKAYEDSETSLDDTQALNALVPSFRTAAKTGQEAERSKFQPRKETRLINSIHIRFKLSKRFL